MIQVQFEHCSCDEGIQWNNADRSSQQGFQCTECDFWIRFNGSLQKIAPKLFHGVKRAAKLIAEIDKRGSITSEQLSVLYLLKDLIEEAESHSIEARTRRAKC